MSQIDGPKNKKESDIQMEDLNKVYEIDKKKRKYQKSQVKKKREWFNFIVDCNVMDCIMYIM